MKAICYLQREHHTAVVVAKKEKKRWNKVLCTCTCPRCKTSQRACHSIYKVL